MKRSNIKSRIKRDELNPVFHFKDKVEDDKILTKGMIKAALKSGKLVLSNKHLKDGEKITQGHLNIHELAFVLVPEKVWCLQDDQEKVKLDVDLNKTKNEDDLWWNQAGLTHLDLSSNVITEISPNVQNLMELTVLNVS